MAVSVVHPKIKKIIRQCERRIMRLTENQCINILVLSSPAKKIPYEEIESIVCDVTGVPIEKATLVSRDHELVITRHLICFYARTNSLISLNALAGKLNRGDHTTIINCVRRLRSLIDSGDPEVCGYVKEINQRIEILKAAS